jgi:hypothetical protein
MSYPLVRDLAADKIPVAVTCRVLGFSKQAFYAWCRNPVSRRDWDDAHLINAAVDVHRDDPEFGYRFIADELPEKGIMAGENRVARLCSQQQIWSAFAKKRGLGRKAGPPVHDDLVARQFTAAGPDRTWLTGITEHPTSEGKLYLCAFKDVYSNRIVGYSMSSRMTAQLAVSGLRNAIALRNPEGTLVVHSDRGSQGGFNRSSQHLVIMEVFGGKTTRGDDRAQCGAKGATTAVGCGSGVAPADAITGPAGALACGAAGVLAADRFGCDDGRGRGGHRCVVAGRGAVVPARWRNAADQPGRARGPLLVVR